VQHGQPADSRGGEAEFAGEKSEFDLTVMGVRRSVQIVFSRERFSMKDGDRLRKKILWCFVTVLCPVAVALGQRQQYTGQLSQEPSSQSQPEQKKTEPSTDAAKKLEKEKTNPKGVHRKICRNARQRRASIVGDEKPGAPVAGGKKTDGTTKIRVAAMSG
jgi:hypothetical protein